MRDGVQEERAQEGSEKAQEPLEVDSGEILRQELREAPQQGEA